MKIKGISYLDLWQAFVHPRITIDLGQWFGRRCHLRYFLSGALSIFLFSGAKIVSEYDQEIPQSQTADNPVAPRGRAAQPSQDTRKTN